MLKMHYGHGLHLGVLAVSCCLVQPANAGTTERVSINSAGVQANRGSSEASVSADGRFVAFTSYAENLFPGDTGFDTDVFVHDRLTGVTDWISGGPEGPSGSSSGIRPSISGDGRFVAFDSYSRYLVPGDTNEAIDVFLRDRLTGSIERISLNQAGQQTFLSSVRPSISADGRFVAFMSQGRLVAGDTNEKTDIYMYNRLTRTVERVNVSTAGAQAGFDSDYASVSRDGRFVAFVSAAANLVAGDTNGNWDVFVRDRLAGTTERVSVDSAGSQGNIRSFGPSISADGRSVAFLSWATNLVAGDTNAKPDIFVHDRHTGVTERVSVSSAGAQASVEFTEQPPSISGDGRYVVFSSLASNLVANDTNESLDVFVRDRVADTTERISVSASGQQGNSASVAPAISASGRIVAFQSLAITLVPGDTNGVEDVFVRDRDPGSGDLLVDFGAAGLSQFLNNSSFEKIHGLSPLALATGDLDGSFQDEAIVSFGGAGLWARYNNSFWRKLHGLTPSRFTAGDVDGSGKDDLIVDFGTPGLWIWVNAEDWVKINNATSQALAVGDLDGSGEDDLVVDFGGPGLWVWRNNATWVRVHLASPSHLAVGDLDGSGKADIVADFGPSGIWAFFDNTTWVRLHNVSSQGLATGDFDGNGKDEVLADLGATGLWAFFNNATWTRLHLQSPTHLTTADLDRSGKDEAVVDFGASGLWARYNNATWTRLSPSSTEGLAAGGFD